MAAVLSKYLADRWLVSIVNISSKRLSKDFHDQLGIDTICAWGSMEPNVKVALRRQLKELCFQKGLFTGRDVEPALEWRLYQLQRNRRAEARKVKPS